MDPRRFQIGEVVRVKSFPRCHDFTEPGIIREIISESWLPHYFWYKVSFGERSAAFCGFELECVEEVAMCP